MSNSLSFDMLHPYMQRWIWQQGWESLRDVQEQAIPAVLNESQDVIIAAATASGKTEAAFLPLLTRLLTSNTEAAHILCISPLKALINDQESRLIDMCQIPELPVVAWHGDVAHNRKKRFMGMPRGILLITPESLEALLVTRGAHYLKPLFRGTAAIVIDELHAFIGEERGKQLQSILHRIDALAGHTLQRVGLSATLGDMGLAAEFLKGSDLTRTVQVVVAVNEPMQLRLQLKGYEATPSILSEAEVQAAEEGGEPVGLEKVVPGNVLAIAQDVYKTLKGSNNLVFPNSRRSVEVYSDLLRLMCEKEGRPNEFWPHHGSLARDVRADAEAALKDKASTATAVATSTLELGVDIGDIRAVAQIEAPPSIASLRQRMGRAGRRNGQAILRTYCSELPLAAAEDVSDFLREGLVQATAAVLLLLDKWCEPPRVSGLHFSTLVQQLLSVIAERQGIQPLAAYSLLVGTGPFKGITPTDFGLLLKHLASKKLLIQDTQGNLHHGPTAESLVSHFDFYAAFSSQEEYQLQATSGKHLGMLPLDKPISSGDYLVFGGKRWCVSQVDMSRKVISVLPAAGARAPSFSGTGSAPVHEHVRAKMRQLYESSETPLFLDAKAQALMAEGRATYQRLKLASASMVEANNKVYLFTWKGDLIDKALALILTYYGITAHAQGLYIEISAETYVVRKVIARVAESSCPVVADITAGVLNMEAEKWDWALPPELLIAGFASLNLDIAGAYDWCKSFR